MNFSERMHYVRFFLKRFVWKMGIFYLIVSLIYFLFLKFPQFLFTNKITYKNITLYSSDNLRTPHKVLSKVDQMIQESEVFNAHEHYRIFIPKSKIGYLLLAPSAAEDFGYYNPFVKNIFINIADPSSLRVTRSSDNNSRHIGSIMVKEMNHQLLHKHLGLFDYLRLPDWIKQGHSGYVTKSTVLSLREGLELMRAGHIEHSQSGKSFIYTRVLAYLLNRKKISFESILNGEIQWEPVKSEYIRKASQ